MNITYLARYIIFFTLSNLSLGQVVAQENEVVLFAAPAMVPTDTGVLENYINDYSAGRGILSSFIDTGTVIFVPAEHSENLNTDLEFGYFTQACSNMKIDGYSDEMAEGFVKYNQSPKQHCSPVQLTNSSDMASINVEGAIETIVLSGLPYVKNGGGGFGFPTNVDSLPYSEQVKWFVMYCDDEGLDKACGPVQPSNPNPPPRNPGQEPEWPILPTSSVYPISKCCDIEALSIAERQACVFTALAFPSICE